MDVFRRHDISGWGKAGWTLFMIVVPFLGVLIYLIAHGQDMGKRDIEQAQGPAGAVRRLRQIGGRTGGGDGAAAEIAKAKGLLDSGAITQAEFDSLKAKALVVAGDG